MVVFWTYSPDGVYSTAIQHHYIYLMMALCGQNKSVNLRESMD
jgi:hypothetical protein